MCACPRVYSKRAKTRKEAIWKGYFSTWERTCPVTHGHSRTRVPEAAHKSQPLQPWCQGECPCALCTVHINTRNADCLSFSRSQGSGQQQCGSQTWYCPHVCISVELTNVGLSKTFYQKQCDFFQEKKSSENSSFFFIFLRFSFVVYVYGCFAYMCVCAQPTRMVSLEVWDHGYRCEIPCVCWKPNLGLLQEQQCSKSLSHSPRPVCFYFSFDPVFFSSFNKVNRLEI